MRKIASEEYDDGRLEFDGDELSRAIITISKRFAEKQNELRKLQNPK
jgi:hypothetical protein